ncbi:MAG TPA: methionyl-tRNA formyltransferase [Burkholderiales bacterium]|nr:methionyl-tRNA formyltransferase [Burkholderiales bacterium]
MRIAFAGTPAFAAVALQALVESHFDLALVLTQPDRPAGRGLRASPSAVKQLALRHGLTAVQPQTLRDEDILAQLRATAARALVVAAYGLILPSAVLDVFPAGCINIHASLLPRWRGAAPIQRAILGGDRETGISIMRMEQGLDTGPVYLTRPMPILPDDTAGTLHDRLAALGARCIVEALPGIISGDLAPEAQRTDGITYAHKIAKPEAAIDWERDVKQLDRQIRAFDPFPGAFSLLRSEPVKIWRAVAGPGGKGTPGEILGYGPDGMDVACGDGVLRVTELQRAGGRRLKAAEFLRGLTPVPGERFGS